MDNNMSLRENSGNEPYLQDLKTMRDSFATINIQLNNEPKDVNWNIVTTCASSIQNASKNCEMIQEHSKQNGMVR